MMPSLPRLVRGHRRAGDKHQGEQDGYGSRTDTAAPSGTHLLPCSGT
jgi:hypothetical protein